jgi:hypothetical protein
MLSTIAKSDVFFVVTTIAVIAITIAIIVLLIYLIGVAKTLRRIALRAETEADSWTDMIASLRKRIKQFFTGKKK